MMKAIGCIAHVLALIICVAALAILIAVPVDGYWRAEGTMPALRILALLLGIAWVWGGWPLRRGR